MDSLLLMKTSMVNNDDIDYYKNRSFELEKLAR